MSRTFSVKICDKNPYRWYVSFSLSKTFSLKEVKEALERENFSTLATTPTVMIFRGKDVKLTWHSQGLIQIDYYDKKIQTEQHISTFVRQLIDNLDFH